MILNPRFSLGDKFYPLLVIGSDFSIIPLGRRHHGLMVGISNCFIVLLHLQDRHLWWFGTEVHSGTSPLTATTTTWSRQYWRF